MTEELNVLISMAAILGFTHTLTGPDHYIPFIVLSKSRNWSILKTTWLTLLCGIGHVTSSIVLASIGLALGFGLKNMDGIDNTRGNISAWLLVLFGLAYMVWGIYNVKKKKPRRHLHFSFGKLFGRHKYNGQGQQGHMHLDEKNVNITPWILFIIFVLGPCEPLIATLVPAAGLNHFQISLVMLVFGGATLATMLMAVLLLSFGLKLTNLGKYEKYSHAMAGGTVLLSGFAIIFLGL